VKARPKAFLRNWNRTDEENDENDVGDDHIIFE